jgi:TPP-dependent pyruvate/acetoin dehydrogenase alpha subunit
LISREKMLALYTSMIRCRRIAVEADRKTGWMRGRPEDDRAVGWEATLAGVIVDLEDGDHLCAAPTCPVQAVLDLLRGHGSSGSHCEDELHGVRNRKHTEDGGRNRIDDGFDKAYRAARAFKTARSGKVVLLLGEEGAGADAWRNRLPDVARRNLPLLIVSRGTLPDGPMSSDEKPAAHRMRTPAALVSGVPVITVDGNDVLAIYRVASESIFRARQRRGPTLIECVSVGASLLETDSDPRKQGLATIPDPIVSMENYLTKRRILTKAVKCQIHSVFCREVNDATGMRLQ